MDAASSCENTKTDAVEKSHPETKTKNGSIFCKTYASLIPKMSLSLEKVVEKNPRISDLREKLNEITRKKDHNMDKNNIYNSIDKREEDESGPYSLLFDLQSNPSSSLCHNMDKDIWGKSKVEETVFGVAEDCKRPISLINKSVERLPNVINFDEKGFPLREFEYSCGSEFSIPVKKTFNTHSRSDLCLQLKSHTHIHATRTFESNTSPNDNSMSRANEENSLDDSLGILTPDQMDDMCYLENTFSPTVEGLPIFCDNNEYKTSPDNGDTPSTDKTESNSAASTIQNDGFENINTNCEYERVCAPIISMEAIMKQDDDNEDAINLPFINAADSKQNNVMHAQEPSIVIDSPSKDNIAEKDQYVSNLEEEFLPSIHSSILEPISSMAENIVNMEIPLDCKHESITNRIEQTPSPEDLPLDSSDINGEISTYSQFSASTLHESQTYSDSKNDYTKSMETSKVSNSFITSITSITSLDGYQGDGEMSRPVSRGADHSSNQEDAIEMDWQNVPVTRRADPMTDSDFFTESDADGLDDHMQRGDRKAQVIDGALYGGKNANGNPPLIVNRNEDSCMESSGVYTDFENHRASPVFLNVIDDMSPAGSTPTRSECSQKNSTGNIIAYFSPLQDTLEDKTPKDTLIDDDETPKNTSKRNSLNSDKGSRSSDKKDEKRSFTLKKYKMPKRDVPSKLKSMLASKKTDADSVQSTPKATKKTDRREALNKKNSLDLKSDYKIKSYKDIKPKVDCSFSLQRSQTSCTVSRMLSSKSTNMNVKPKR
ncbi:Toucan protein [Operophtera brumata]|uniref:Toucan protein n=1 Tax=Operophtera brumata TaxID=104452 RepID=A0A0L7KYF8_OPEBR|nr:Toucan protein [Operophtera brumata]